MDRKVYLLALCDSLVTERPLAWWLKVLLERNIIDDHTIDALLTIVQSAIKESSSKSQELALSKAQVFLLQLKQMEDQYHLKDMEDIKKLEDILANI